VGADGRALVPLPRGLDGGGRLEPAEALDRATRIALGAAGLALAVLRALLERPVGLARAIPRPVPKVPALRGPHGAHGSRLPPIPRGRPWRPRPSRGRKRPEGFDASGGAPYHSPARGVLLFFDAARVPT